MNRTAPVILLAIAALACFSQVEAAELSAAQVAQVLGVPVATAKTEKTRGSAQSFDTTYESAQGVSVVIVHRGPASLWAQTREVSAAQSEPFSGVTDAYRVKGLNMVCGRGAANFACVTPMIHFMTSGKQPSDDALRALLRASL